MRGRAGLSAAIPATIPKERGRSHQPHFAAGAAPHPTLLRKTTFSREGRRISAVAERPNTDASLKI